MLTRFWVENYRCFRERIILDMTNKKNYSYGTECVRGDFLDKVVVIGDNGAGKTSFGYALVDIITTLTGFQKDIGQNEESCFLNGDSDEDVATFHYEFLVHSSYVEYEYGKPSPHSIVRERLSVDHKVVFDYDLRDMSGAVFNLDVLGDVYMSPESIYGSKALLRMIGETSRLSDVPAVKAVLDFARDSVYYRAMWRMDEHIGIIDDDDDICGYIIDNGLVEDLQEFLRTDCHTDVLLGVEEGRLVICTGRRNLPFLKAASRGTVLLTRLYCWDRRSKNREALMFLDDFDDMFNYQTSENVMERIIRKGVAQCVFVTHNAELISDDALRPDCCFILNGRKLLSLSSLTDKNIRRGHNLAKMLRDGEFNRTVG